MYHILQGVDDLCVVYYAESKLPKPFTAGSHCYLRGVDHENLNDSQILKETILTKLIYGCEILPKGINLTDKKRVPHG